MLRRLRVWMWRRRYRPGVVLSEFVAPDIRREVEVVDATRIAEGLVTVRSRTWNVLYTANGLSGVPAEAGPPTEMAIADLWAWSGEPWGGPVPD